MANRYWVGGTGTWNTTTTTNWSATSGGAGGASAPTSADNAIFDSSSNGGASAFTVTLSVSADCQSFSFSSLAGVMTLAGSGNLNVYNGNLTFVSANLNLTGTGTIVLAPTSGNTFTITMAGQTWPGSIWIGTGTGITSSAIFTMQDALTIAGQFRLNAGSISLNGFTLTAQSFNCPTGVTSATLSMPTTSKLTLTGNNTTIFTGVSTLSISGSQNIYCTYSGSTGTRTIDSTVSSTAAPNFYITDGTDTVNISSVVRSLDFTGFRGTYFNAGTTSVYGNLTFVGPDMSITATSNAINLPAVSSSFTITTNKSLINFPMNIGSAGTGATWTMQDELTIAPAYTCTHTAGVLTLNNYILTAGFFLSNTANNRTIAFGTGNITITGNSGTVFSTSTITGLTITGTPVVNFTYSGSTGTRTIEPGLLTEASAISFNIKNGSDTFALGNNSSFNNLNFTGFSGTFAGSTFTKTIYGSLTFSPTMVSATGTGLTTFAATSGTKTVTTYGLALSHSITFAGVGGSWQLIDSLTTDSSSTVTLTSGTLDLNNNTITTGIFSITGSSTRVLTMGTGGITLTGNGTTIWSASDLTGLTVTGNQQVNCTYSGSTGTRTIVTGVTSGTEANSFTFNISAGSDIISITASSKIANLNFAGFGSGSLADTAITVYGNLFLAPTMTITGSSVITMSATSGTQQIYSSGTTLDRPVTFDGVGGTFLLGENLTVGSTRTVTLTNGTLNLNNKVFSCGIFSSNNSNTRTLAFGTGSITLTGNAATIWTTVTVTGLTLSGTPVVNCTYSGSTGTRAISPGAGHTEASSISFNITAGTDIIGHSNGAVFKDLNFTGFSGTLTDGGATMTIYGDLTLSPTMTNTGSSSAVTFAATSGTKTFTTGGIVFDNPITFNGAGGTWQIVGNLTMATVTYTLTLTNGTFDANGYNATIGLFSSANANTRALNLGTGTWNIIGSGATAWNLGTTTGMTLTRGTATINMSSATAKTFVGGGLTYPILNQGGTGTLTITGSNTFNTISNTTQPATVSFTAATTTTVTNFMLSGTSGNLITIGSVTAASHTISVPVGTVTVSYCTISRSTATGGASFRAPTSNGCVDGLNNSGWVFTALGKPVGTMLAFFS
jgi:fibronectin-binding autotransporter adhesin